MKKHLLSLIITIFLSNFVSAQSISFTSETLTTAEIGSTITVNYQYTIASDGYIFCGINLLDDWNWVSMVASAELNPAVAGTNVQGSFQITIPENTTPTANLTGNLNYKISIELKDSNFVWLAGDYPPTQINFTEPLSTTNLQANTISLFPNPTNDFIRINGIDINAITQVSIVDMLGKNVFYSSKLEADKIDVSNLTPGVYMLSVLSDNTSKTIKFVKR